ncbi:MAG: mechanosensitive ion channel family protein [Chloroflexota bacterium]
MDTTFFQSELFVWVISLVIGLPLFIIILGELIERLAQQNNPLVPGLRYIRHVTLPLLSILILLQQIIRYTGSPTLVRIIETIFWFTVIYSTFAILGSLTKISEANPHSIVARLPSLFFTISRAAVLGVIIAYVMTIWEIDISSLFAAIGVGALAISLALQDTISNVVSGMLLIADRPFQTGDWITYNDDFYVVEEINWRATRLRSRTNSVLVVPNGILGGAAVENLGHPGSMYHMIITIDYSDDYPPNYISDILLELLQGIDGIHEQPSKPFVRISSYGDSVIIYDMEFWIDFTDYLRIPHEVNNRLYYIAKRYNLPRPSPVRIINVAQIPESEQSSDSSVKIEMLQMIPLYRTLPEELLKQLTAQSQLYHYGKGEFLIRHNEANDSLYLIQSGQLFLFVIDEEGEEQLFLQLSKGEIFGAMTLLHDKESPFSAVAIDDLVVIQTPHEAVSHLLTTHTRFATALNTYIEDRQQRLDTLIGRNTSQQQLTMQDDWMTSIGV